MSCSSTTVHKSHGILDRVAIGMAAVCAVHCLLTPILVMALPIIATSFFVHKDFHLWMILLVLPTTGFAIFMGCRKHKDKWVAAMSAIGLGILLTALVHERMQASAQLGEHAASAHVCEHCVGPATETASGDPVPMHAGAWFNTFGGLILASAHFRNFRLCRKSRCTHD
jgi:uncharacterized membrane protein